MTILQSTAPTRRWTALLLVLILSILPCALVPAVAQETPPTGEVVAISDLLALASERFGARFVGSLPHPDVDHVQLPCALADLPSEPAAAWEIIGEALFNAQIWLHPTREPDLYALVPWDSQGRGASLPSLERPPPPFALRLGDLPEDAFYCATFYAVHDLSVDAGYLVARDAKSIGGTIYKVADEWERPSVFGCCGLLLCDTKPALRRIIAALDAAEEATRSSADGSPPGRMRVFAVQSLERNPWVVIRLMQREIPREMRDGRVLLRALQDDVEDRRIIVRCTEELVERVSTLLQRWGAE